MKLIAGLLRALTACAAPIEQAYLDTELANDRAAWAMETDVTAIVSADLGPCPGLPEHAIKPGLEYRLGWSDLITRIITINSSCTWDTGTLHTVIQHEYGHMLIGSPAHLLDRRSVMFYCVLAGQTIRDDDRTWARNSLEWRRERPSLHREN